MTLNREPILNKNMRGEETDFSLSAKNEKEFNIVSNRLQAVFPLEISIVGCPCGSECVFIDCIRVDFSIIDSFKLHYVKIKKETSKERALARRS